MTVFSIDAIQRAINKGAGVGDDKLTLEHVVYEGRAPHNVPVIVEVYTDNVQRTAPEIRHLFRTGSLGQPGSVAFFFNHLGVVEATHADANRDAEGDAIEAGAIPRADVSVYAIRHLQSLKDSSVTPRVTKSSRPGSSLLVCTRPCRPATSGAPPVRGCAAAIPTAVARVVADRSAHRARQGLGTLTTDGARCSR